MNCTQCDSGHTKKFGKDRKGNQRFRCLACGATFQEAQHKPLGDMLLPIEKALLALELLVEGNSVRSTARVTKIHHATVLALLETVGEKCLVLFDELLIDIPVRNVQCDEIWGFCGMKEKTKKLNQKESDESIGDAWCFIAIEHGLCYHINRKFIEKR